MNTLIFVRLRPGLFVRADQVASMRDNRDGSATLTMLSGAEINAPEITARKALNILIREVSKVVATTSDEEERP